MNFLQSAVFWSEIAVALASVGLFVATVAGLFCIDKFNRNIKNLKEYISFEISRIENSNDKLSNEHRNNYKEHREMLLEGERLKPQIEEISKCTQELKNLAIIEKVDRKFKFEKIFENQDSLAKMLKENTAAINALKNTMVTRCSGSNNQYR